MGDGKSVRGQGGHSPAGAAAVALDCAAPVSEPVVLRRLRARLRPCARITRGRTRSCPRARAGMLYGWVFFPDFVRLAARTPHGGGFVRAGGPNETGLTELAPIGVRLNGSCRAP